MTFEKQIIDFAEKIPKKLDAITTEETTKIALILPLLRKMGYDTTDPTEVRAEFTADIGNKQGEKVDFAILNEGNVEILIECKSVTSDLTEDHLSQLLRYYMTTDAQLGILTNGIIYQFYTDSTEDGKMDTVPFFELDMMNLNPKNIKRLEKFCKDSFDVNQVCKNAKELKYNYGVKKVLLKEFNEPSEEFTKVIAKQVYEGILSPRLKETFSLIIENKIKEIIDEKVDARLDKAIKNTEKDKENNEDDVAFIEDENTNEPSQLEMEGFYIVKSICSEVVDVDRIVIRNRQTFMKILLDDNQFYPVLTLYFKNKNNLKIEFNGEWYENNRHIRERTKEKFDISEPSDIFKFKSKILEHLNLFLEEKES